MAPAMPQFPSLEAWRKMDERDQDALIDRMEAARHWRRLGMRALLALTCGAACFGLGALAALL
jgi:hypothetical protein